MESVPSCSCSQQAPVIPDPKILVLSQTQTFNVSVLGFSFPSLSYWEGLRRSQQPVRMLPVKEVMVLSQNCSVCAVQNANVWAMDATWASQASNVTLPGNHFDANIQFSSQHPVMALFIMKVQLELVSLALGLRAELRRKL